VAAVDLGGTKIRSLLVDAAGQLLAADQRATDAERGQAAVIERILESVRAATVAARLRIEDLVGVGVAAPGPVDFWNGVVLEAPNLPGWQDVPLAAILAEQLGRPAYLENDANAAAIGEHRFGAGRGVQQMIYLTISTGIGAGLILDGRLYRGTDGTAGELGHVVVDPHGPFDDCGLPGCLEIMASGTAIARMGREAAVAAPDDSPLRRRAELGEITTPDVHAAALAGDPLAAAILGRAAESLALGLASFINIFNPQLFVIGGGTANIWDAYVEPAFAAAQRLAFARPAATVRLLPASLGPDSGALGMAALVLDQLSA
jgi:glucokinase